MTFEVVVLGSGTSNGVPTLGVHYPSTFLANPKNHRTRPSIALLAPGGVILVDAATEMRIQLLRERIDHIDAVVLTHTHADHIMGMDDLRSFCLRTKKPMPVYAWPQYQEDVRRVFPYAFQDFPEGVEVPRFTLQELPPRLELCGLELNVLEVTHGPLPVAALRVGDFAYVTDVGNIPPPAWDGLQGLKTLILDAVRYRPHPNHFHFDKAVEVAHQLAATTTYFTHLSHDYDHDEVESTLPASIRLAYDGLRIMVEVPG